MGGWSAPVAEEKAAFPTVLPPVVNPAAIAMMQGWCAPIQVRYPLSNSRCVLTAGHRAVCMHGQEG